MTRGRLGSGAIVAALVAAGLAFCRDAAFFGLVPARRDAGNIFFPVLHYARNCFAHGEIPRWLPTDGGGTSLLALPLAVLHPVQLLNAALPFERAFAWMHVAALLCALVGAFGLARRLGAGRFAAALGAIAYAFSGVYCSLLEWLPLALSAAAAPWFLWAIAALAEGSRAALPGAAVALGLVVLGGDLQLAGEVIALGVGLGALVGGRRGALLALGAGVLGLGVGAPQWLASAALWRGSVRADGVPEATALRWSLEPRRVAELAFAPRAYWANELLPSIYAGPLTLALAAVAIASRRKVAIGLGVAALLCLAVALGPATGLYAALREVVPVWKSFRFPQKLLVPFALCLAPLAALGAQRISAARPWLAAALALVALGDAWRANQGLWQLAPPDFFAPPPLARALRGKPGAVFSAPIDYPEDATLVERDRRTGASLSADRALLWGFRNWDAYQWAVSARLKEVLSRAGPRWLELAPSFGVAHFIVSDPQPAWLLARAEARDPAEGFTSLALDALPLAYVPGAATPVAPEDAANRVLAPGFLPGRLTYVEGDVPASVDQPGASSTPVAVGRRTCSSLELDADLPHAGVIVVNEPNAPGWTATVDGAPAPVWTANALVRAVPAPAGRHHVVLTYRTPGLAAGALLAALALALSAALALRRQ